jgi:hypothetical protein
MERLELWLLEGCGGHAVKVETKLKRGRRTCCSSADLYDTLIRSPKLPALLNQPENHALTTAVVQIEESADVDHIWEVSSPGRIL